MGSCLGDAFACVRDVPNEDGQKAWEELEQKYKSASETRKATLRNELFGLEKKTHKLAEVKDFLTKVQDLKTELQEIGEKVDESQLIGIIEGGLPREFVPLVIAFKQRETPLDLKGEVNQIKHCTDYLIKLQQKEEEAEAIAMLSQVKEHKRRESLEDTRPKKKKFNGKCDNCSRMGHMKKDCFRPGGGAHDPAKWRSDKQRDETSPEPNKYQLSYLGYTVEIVSDVEEMISIS